MPTEETLNYLISPAELAYHWNLSEKKLEFWRYDGNGPPYIKTGRSIWYRPAEINHFEEAHPHLIQERKMIYQPLPVNEKPIPLARSFAKQVGLPKALILQHLYLVLRSSRTYTDLQGKHWIHNTHKQWQKHFPFWDVRKIQRIFKALEKEGLIFSARKCHFFPKTKCYSVNDERIMLRNKIIIGVHQKDPNKSDAIEGPDHPDLSDCSSNIIQNEVNQHPKSVPSNRTKLSHETHVDSYP